MILILVNYSLKPQWFICLLQICLLGTAAQSIPATDSVKSCYYNVILKIFKILHVILRQCSFAINVGVLIGFRDASHYLFHEKLQFSLIAVISYKLMVIICQYSHQLSVVTCWETCLGALQRHHVSYLLINRFNIYNKFTRFFTRKHTTFCSWTYHVAPH